MLFAGFGVSQGRYSLLAITVAGVLGNLVGSWLSYGVGYFGRIELVERHAGKLHIKAQHLAWADRWFARYGTATVFFTRMLPLIRTFISLPAGVARMPFLRLTVFTLFGCIPWVFLLGFIGDQVGHNWTHWKDNLRYVDYVVVAAVPVAVVYLTLRWLANRRASRRSLARSGPEGEHHFRAAQQHGADLEDEAGSGHALGQSRIPVLESVARVNRDTTEGPRHRDDERSQREAGP